MILCAEQQLPAQNADHAPQTLFMAFIPASLQTAGLDGQNVKKKYQNSLEGLGEQLEPFFWKSS